MHILLSGSEPTGSPNITFPSHGAGKRARPIYQHGQALSPPRAATGRAPFSESRFMGVWILHGSRAELRLAHDPAQLLGTDLAGLPFPQVNEQLPGKGDNRLLASSPWRLWD